jgi:hypothetical protein
MIVVEKTSVGIYLKKRNLTKQYLKVKQDIVNDNYKAVDLKKRKPHSNNIWYFRITKKYRAFAEKIDNTLYVFHISDHQ